MWKWTDSKNIKAIILDTEALDNTILEFPYEQYLPEVKIFCIKGRWIVDSNRFTDTFDYLSFVMKHAACESYSIISISGDFMFLKEMMQYHIGTILIGELKKDFLGNIPDFVSHSTMFLQKILTNEVKGYAAEVYATYANSYGGKSLLKHQKEIRLNNGELKVVNMYFGGRYYAQKHQHIYDDPLSVIVREFKKDILSQ